MYVLQTEMILKGYQGMHWPFNWWSIINLFVLNVRIIYFTFYGVFLL